MTFESADLAPRVITLGTAGGPRWWGTDPVGRRRNGIATAVVVGPAVYVVDCGRGASTQFAEAGLSMDRLRGVFLTHLHSDHTVDLAGMLLFGWMMSGPRPDGPIPVIGPGDRGMLPAVNPRAIGEVAPLTPQAPTSGTVQLVEHLLTAYSADVTDRMLDSLRPSPYTLFAPQDVTLPEHSGYHPNLNPSPAGLEPFTVFEDEFVRVTATLVVHPPVAPAFAFRFDTEHGSVTISGDTAPSENLVRLATGTDLLLHEAIDMGWAEASYRDVDAATREATLDHHRKSHTTPRQAGQVAAAAGVGTLALHHLVPGHADASVWHEATETFSGPVVVPEDLQSITVARRPRPALAATSL
ncbi:MBL fold metallo-hydrolase [Micrococcus sp. TA1]|uniref:MBL fold metallo-hydrolase n=1 Tax=Micrococcus sp. TA1 TaxID=681627 RepID=UPI0016180C3E|nr:MBL fold metallo-hydrolase [Micrococcus sp. TA1]MBB5750405.1 ribonuclease BN (tRNA processing enzyme) [Micrococcus sp. TA1]